jgi:hypothetical protein
MSIAIVTCRVQLGLHAPLVQVEVSLRPVLICSRAKGGMNSPRLPLRCLPSRVAAALSAALPSTGVAHLSSYLGVRQAP